MSLSAQRKSSAAKWPPERYPAHRPSATLSAAAGVRRGSVRSAHRSVVARAFQAGPAFVAPSKHDARARSVDGARCRWHYTGAGPPALAPAAQHTLICPTYQPKKYETRPGAWAVAMRGAERSVAAARLTKQVLLRSDRTFGCPDHNTSVASSAATGVRCGLSRITLLVRAMACQWRAGRPRLRTAS